MANEKPLLTDLIEQSRTWQLAVLSTNSYAESDALGLQANNELRKHPAVLAAQRIIVRASKAYMFPDGLTSEEAFWPSLEFEDVTLSGDLAGPRYVRPGKVGLITWPIHNAQIHTQHEVEITPDSDPSEGAGYYLSTDREVRRPLYAPIYVINYALAAA